MLYRIRGKIVDKPPFRCLLALEWPGGEVVLEIVVPLSTHERLGNVGETQELLIYPHFSDRGLTLYGFLNDLDRRLFQVLLELPNVNRGLALRLLSHMSAEDLLVAVAQENRSVFEQVPGIGRKRAERLVFELKQHLAEFPVREPGGTSTLLHQALRALVQLGLKESEARERLERLKDHIGPETSLEELLRRALQETP